MNYLPHSKHMHILTAIPNCFFQSLAKPNTQPREEFVPGGTYGVGDITRFTWKDLFDSYSCTECGRCQDACPATTTGKSLNPRQVVHDIKINLLRNGPLLKKGEKPLLPLIGDEGEGANTEATIWGCTTCGACLEACPVFIEQMPKIVQMRRHLVEMEAKFPEELLNLFENMEQRSNPWGIAPSERTKWCSTLDVKPFSKDETEYLFFIGCAGAFDARQKHVTVAMAAILDAAGVSWGILGKDELCCGDSLRRLGNEYVFDKIAKENARMFRDKGVTKGHRPVPALFLHPQERLPAVRPGTGGCPPHRAHQGAAGRRPAQAEPAGDRARENRVPRLLLPGAAQRCLRGAAGSARRRNRVSPCRDGAQPRERLLLRRRRRADVDGGVRGDPDQPDQGGGGVCGRTPTRSVLPVPTA